MATKLTKNINEIKIIDKLIERFPNNIAIGNTENRTISEFLILNIFTLFYFQNIKNYKLVAGDGFEPPTFRL